MQAIFHNHFFEKKCVLYLIKFGILSLANRFRAMLRSFVQLALPLLFGLIKIDHYPTKPYNGFDQGMLKEDHCTIDLFDWFRLVYFANKNRNCQLSYSRLQTSQTGGQWYNGTSPLVFPG
jgi:hypothetical protein